MSAIYRRVRVPGLTIDERRAWGQIQESNAGLGSPYFRAEFSEMVAAERSDVFVTVIENGGRAVGFFPFQRGFLGAGRPVGGPLSDFHGVVAAPDAEWEAEKLVRASGLSSWSFDHLASGQPKFAAYVKSEDRSPMIDLSAGYEAYITGRRAEGSKQILKVEGLARKLEREVGTIRVDLDCQDLTVFERVLAWKSAQCAEAKLPDLFAVPWTRALLGRLLRTRTPEFAGVLSALYVGDELAAAHMGMRSSTVWHYWFPSYDEKFSKFSAGLLLLLRMAQGAPAMGLTRIDLGKGETMYKQRLMSGAEVISEGRVEVPSIGTALGRLRRSAEVWSATGVIAAPVRLSLKALRRVEIARKFQ